MRQYVGARYVPKFDGDWVNNKTYEALTVVTYMGDSYTSKKPVPVNTLPTDTEYWAISGAYNAQISQLSTNVTAIKHITDGYVTPEDYGAVGDGVTDDTGAIEAMLLDAHDNNKVITSDMSKEYLISNDIVIDNIIINFGTFKGDVAGRIVTVNTLSIIDGCNFYNCSVESSRFYTQISNVTIAHFSGNGLKIGIGDSVSDYDVKYGDSQFHDIMINNYDLASDSCTGVWINGVDIKIRNVTIINSAIAFKISGSHNELENCYAWRNAYTTFTDSKCFNIEASGNRLINCTADTYQYCFYSATANLSNEIVNFMFLNNNTIAHDSAFYFINQKEYFKGSALIDLAGMSAANNTFTCNSFCRLDINVINGDFADGNPYGIGAGIATSSQGGVFKDTSCYSVKNGIFEFHGVIEYTGGITLNSTDVLTLSLPNPVKAELFGDALCLCAMTDSSSNDIAGWCWASINGGWSHNIQLYKDTFAGCIVNKINIDMTVVMP